MGIEELVQCIAARKPARSDGGAMLVGISGIDGSGKGYVTKRLDDRLTSEGFRTAAINIDGWLNLPHVRFDTIDLPGNFYRYAIRFDEMFEQLVLPLRENRSIDLTSDFAEETAAEFRRHNYAFENIDIILLEGIFLFKREFLRFYDLKVWIDCSFELALERAIARSQEGLSAEDTIQAYESIYFPAQRIHFKLDDPKGSADVLIDNSTRLGAAGTFET